MKLEKRVLALAIAFGLSFWVVDAVMDFCFFYQGTFINLLIKDVTPHEIYIRSFTLAVFTLFGIIIAHIVAKLKEAERVYRNAEQTGRAIFNTISDAVFLHPLMKEGFAPFVDVNATACKRYGYTREEFLTLTAPKITKKADANAHSNVDHRKKLREAGQMIFEATHITRSGKEFPVEINSSVVELNGRPMILAVVRDISDRKRIEEERLALERQVQHAQKLESLGVLAGGIAHDFNNLLMTILGNADLALDDISPMSPARENLREIEKTAKRAAELAKQMLAYSGKGNFVIQPINLNELVSEMGHMLQVSISKKAVLKYNFADRLPLFEGDATQLRQVIMNLITNASDAIGDQSGIIAISTGAMDCSSDYLNTTTIASLPGLSDPLPEGVYVYVEVADTGCGMDMDTQQKLFDPFFTTKFTGRGLGMAAVQGIVRGHNGTIKVYSEVGKGTTFKVLFPVSENSALVREYFGNKTQDATWRGQGTVLLVDDEESVRAVGKLMLEKIGFKVLTAADGRQALEVFNAHTDDIVCVLLDLTMPHLNGEEAFREMRHVRQNVKVIITSGYNENDATQRFIGKGLAGFIQKPYSFSLLAAKMRAVLEKEG
jgi:two-component system cell cycle sensor histidine kinase/response regulator CckA